jgi:hypothetical protein
MKPWIAKLFRRTTRTGRLAPTRRRAPLEVEALGDRIVPAATFFLANGVLTIDAAWVGPGPAVVSNDEAGQLVVQTGSDTTYFAPGSVWLLRYVGSPGEDHFTNTTKLRAEATGKRMPASLAVADTSISTPSRRASARL